VRKGPALHIVITGAGGRIGSILERHLQSRFPDRVVAATREELDLVDYARLALEMERLSPSPTVAVNCAAFTDPRGAELAPEESLASNREAVANLARVCRELSCRLIHVSTVDVFSGRKPGPYAETDTPDPATQYGRIRYLGELAAAEESPNLLVLRLSLACGDGEPGDPLVAVREALERGTSLEWEDRRVSPIFEEDLGAALSTILRNDWRGVLHLAQPGSCLLSELVAETVRLLGGSGPPELSGGQGPASFWERSGANAALDTALFQSLSGRRLRDWREALAANLGRGEER
jgi:dTDP-4-dehydrorhamnose reductase